MQLLSVLHEALLSSREAYHSQLPCRNRVEFGVLHRSVSSAVCWQAFLTRHSGRQRVVIAGNLVSAVLSCKTVK